MEKRSGTGYQSPNGRQIALYSAGEEFAPGELKLLQGIADGIASFSGVHPWFKTIHMIAVEGVELILHSSTRRTSLQPGEQETLRIVRKPPVRRVVLCGLDGGRKDIFVSFSDQENKT